MKDYEKEVIQSHLNDEKAVLKKLEQTYQEALDNVNDDIAKLMGRGDADLQHVIYQKEYQQSIKKQLEGHLETLRNNNFETISEYLTKSYEEGFVGTMYSIQKQGIPLVLPMDQEQIINAITHDTKLSVGLYASLGKDIVELKKQISSEISRGISTNMTYMDIAKNVERRAGISRGNASRIARTEGHRISSKASMDACEKAKDRGADVVKQWDATLDGRTRPSHRAVDGEIRELEETFSNGLMYPSDPNGGASESINCRCVLLQRARWAVDDSFTKYDGDANEIVSFKDAKDYESFKEAYWKAMDEQLVMQGAQKMSNLSDEGLIERYRRNKGVKAVKQSFESGLKNMSNQNARIVLEDIFNKTTIKGAKGSKSSYSGGTISLGKNGNASTLAHEEFHDLFADIQKTDNEFLKTELFDDYAKLYVDARMQHMEIDEYLAHVHPEIFSDLDNYIVHNQYRGFSDIIHGLSDGKVDLGFGHREDGYWLVNNHLQSEALAQYGRVYFDSDESVLKLHKEVLPKTTNAVDEKVKEIADVLRKKNN